MWRFSGGDKEKQGLAASGTSLAPAPADAPGPARAFRQAPARSIPEAEPGTRRLLHVGCGRASPQKLHRVFRAAEWREVRLDADEEADPDILCSVADMREAVPDASFDALWASHVIEHLHTHEAPFALREFRRALKPGGYALIRTPDLAAVAAAILTHGADHVAYVAPAGPITPLDMLFGHGRSIRKGSHYMAHHTAFTAERLGRMLVAAGFAEARTLPLPEFDLWALALTPGCAPEATVAELARAGLDFSHAG